MPAAVIAATASTVGCASRQFSGVPPLIGSQQLNVDVQPSTPSMFGMQLETGHATSLQFGPPSVARMTNVRPESLVSVGKRSRSVAAVGVPPNGPGDVTESIVDVVGPCVPAGESP